MRARTLALFAGTFLGCGECGDPPMPRTAPVERAESLEQPQPSAPSDPEALAAAEPEPAEQWPRPGWHAVSVENDVPLCVFASHQARAQADFVEQAEKQKLRAGSSVVFGAFAGYCVNEACDDRPSLQCWVEREGKTLVVHSRYWGDRKDGAKCENVTCRPIIAGCETPPLEAGEYTVRHGDVRFQLRIPSELREPCFGTEPRSPPE
jgi:hypothetical protein